MSLEGIFNPIVRVYFKNSSGGSFEGDTSSPEYVYAVTRPKDWLPMPRPTDHECFCLGQILPGHKESFIANISFSGECTVEFGTVTGGNFIPFER
jgi:hypothetical protein